MCEDKLCGERDTGEPQTSCVLDKLCGSDLVKTSCVWTKLCGSDLVKTSCV